MHTLIIKQTFLRLAWYKHNRLILETSVVLPKLDSVWMLVVILQRLIDCDDSILLYRSSREWEELADVCQMSRRQTRLAVCETVMVGSWWEYRKSFSHMCRKTIDGLRAKAECTWSMMHLLIWVSDWWPSTHHRTEVSKRRCVEPVNLSAYIRFYFHNNLDGT